LALAAVVFTPAAQAATQREKVAQAQQLVDEALENEAQGLIEKRNELLQAAIALDPDFAPARWHAGQVEVGGEWIAAADAPQRIADDRRLAAYEAKRAQTAASVAEQWELASWCRKRGLIQQERAHLSQIIEQSPDHAPARARLGFVRVDNNWVLNREIAEAREEAATADRNFKAWRPELTKIVAGLRHSSLRRQDAAKDSLRAIDDTTAIPALEAGLTNLNEDAATLLIETLSQIDDYDATLALARQAIVSPWESVRAAAATELKSHSTDVFVPALLAEIYTPVQSRTELHQGRGKRMVYRHVFYREGQNDRDLATLDTVYKRIANGGDGRATEAAAREHAQQQAQAREEAVARQNAMTQMLNERIFTALATSTGEDLPAQPQSWWDWWTAYNEVYVAGPKPISEIRREEEIKIADSGPGGFTGIGVNGGGMQTMDCLAAGTKVWTITGPVAIDKVQVGDMVLSQDPATGELAYKPVLRTTIRPASQLTQVKIGAETIAASGGHPFWVSGHGWVKARDLEYAVELHQADGAARIDEVKPGETAMTYNLVVADFHSYFVGNAKVLSHDNTVREVTENVVPGFELE
jgi:hypothetical protein